MNGQVAAPLPVTILTGFLGAGKTTLLNRLLRADHGLRLGVIVNDFGAINIDARLIDVVRDDTISLANGCVCCSMRGNLVTTTLGLLEGSNPPQHLLIEASGIADPASIANTFRTSALSERTRLDGIIALVDAENARDTRLDSQLIEEQIRTADIVVLNKIDLIGAPRRTELLSWIRGLAPAARVIPAIQADVPLQALIGTGSAYLPSTAREVSGRGGPVWPPARSTGAGRHTGTAPTETRSDWEFASPGLPSVPEATGEADATQLSHAYDSWSYITEKPLAYRALRAALESLPAEIFRAKGTVALADAPNLRFAAHAVGRRVSIEPDRPWGDETRRTEIVLIGAAGAVTDGEVLSRFDACITQSVVLMSRQNLETLKRAVRLDIGSTSSLSARPQAPRATPAEVPARRA